MVNVENIRKTRDAIARLVETPERFSMPDWATFLDDHPLYESSYYNDEGEEYFIVERLREGDCKTAACVAGWAVVACTNDKKCHGYLQRGQELFGLTDHEAKRLFCPWNYPYDEDFKDVKFIGNPEKATPQEAVKVLDYLIANGKIDWNAAWR